MVSQCFSHFSWQLSRGFLIIVDLQGVTGILTDPQIHCYDYKRFGKGNLGYEGILQFFLTHQCNHYCEKLQLVHPKKVSALPPHFHFFNEEMLYKDFQMEMKEVQTLCDLCKKAFNVNSNSIYMAHKNSQELYCQACTVQKKSTMKSGICIDCHSNFWSSTYWFKMVFPFSRPP